MQGATFSYKSMGTDWSVTIYDPIPEATINNLKQEIIEASQNFDNLYSRFKPNSLVSQIAKAPGSYEVPNEFLEMLAIYQSLYLPAEKKLNPLIGFAISDLGYDENYSLHEKSEIRKVPDLLETVSVKNNIVTVNQKVLFDFGALGKGYFVDKIADLLKQKGLKNFLVNGSGDIYYFSDQSASFGLEDPEDDTKIIGKLEIGQATNNTELRAFCASATNRRKWPGQNRDLNHELDATNLSPADFIIATWVQAEETKIADALCTCLFFVAPENFNDYRFEYLLMSKDRRVKKSANFSVELY